MENKNHSPVNIRFVAKTTNVRNFSQDIRSDLKTSEVSTLFLTVLPKFAYKCTVNSVATLLWRKTTEFTLKKKTENNKKPRHTKCLKKVKTRLQKHATGTCTQKIRYYALFTSYFEQVQVYFLTYWQSQFTSRLAANQMFEVTYKAS